MFRASETAEIGRILQAGESASLVGVYGVGKSNLFTHLLAGETQAHLFGDAAGDYVFVRIDCDYAADLTPRSVYSLILDQIELALNSEGDLYNFVVGKHDQMLAAADDALRVHRAFTLALRRLMRDPRRKLVLLIDEFEQLWRNGDERIFLNLRGLRDAYKRRVMYVTFTQSSLNSLTDVQDKGRGTFHSLLETNEIGLPPYARADAREMLEELAQRFAQAVSVDEGEQLLHASGGHARLLRVLLLSPKGVDRVAQRIFDSLTYEEQAAIFHLANGTSNFDRTPFASLRKKGVISAENQVAIPAFADFLKRIALPDEQGLLYNDNTRRIVFNGFASTPLTPLEHRVFNVLHTDIEAVVTHDAIKMAGWGTTSGVDSDTVGKLISRIRARLKEIKIKPKDVLVSERGLGYRLTSP